MSEKAKGWDARDAHLLKRIEEETATGAPVPRRRWVCSCSTSTGRNRTGRWTYQSDGAAREAWKRHAQKDEPKPSEFRKGLGKLLKLDG